MAAPDERTAHVPTTASPAPRSGGDGLDLRTLIITAIASAASAFICSKVWAPGTLASAAFTPVAVALFREGLRRPTAVVSQALPSVAQALPVGRRSASTAAGAPADGTLRSVGAGGPAVPTAVRPRRSGPRSGPGAGYDPGEPPYDPGVPPYELDGPSGASVDPAPMTIYSAKRPFRHRWRLALITGLLGFAIAATAVTVPELIAGGSASGGGNTTFFSGSKAARTSSDKDKDKSKDKDKPKTTTTTKTETKTKTAPTTTTAPSTTETTPSTTPDPATATPGAAGQQQTPTTTEPTAPPASETAPSGGAASGGATPPAGAVTP